MSSKKRQQPRIDQNFMDMMRPIKTFNVMGLDVHARSLMMSHFGELKSIFSHWQSFDVTELLNSSESLEAFATVIWMGVREDTPELATKEYVFVAVNLHTLNDWQPVVEYISGVQFQNNDDTDTQTSSESSSESSENAAGNGS